MIFHTSMQVNMTPAVQIAALNSASCTKVGHKGFFTGGRDWQNSTQRSIIA